MRFTSINNAVFGFLLLTTIAAVYVIASPGSGDNWIINPLTGITAIAFSLLAFARLSVGAPNRIAKHIWRGTILVFCTVAASQFLEGYRQLLSQKYGIDDIADCVLLVVSPVTMWMISKFDPPPLFTRGLFLLGFLLQSVSTVLDVLNALFISHWGWDTAFIDLITDLGQFASLQIYLIAVATFLVSLHLHQRPSSRGTRTVGQLSRYLFVRLRLFNKMRYPHLPFRIPGVAPLIALGLWWFHFATWVPMVGAQLRARSGKSVGRQVLDIFQLGLASGMDARAYYMFDIYRQGGLESSAGYLTLFETQNGLFQAIGDFIARPLKQVRSPLKDRAEFYAFCDSHQLPYISPLILDEYNRLEQIAGAVPRQSRDVVLVPYRHAAIKGTELYQHIGNGRFLDKTGATLSSGEVFAKQMSIALGQHAILMPRLVNHPDLAVPGANAYAGLQIVTCMTPDHQPIVTHALMQVYQTERSWSGRPDLVAPVRLSDGLIGAAMAAGRDMRQQPQRADRSRLEGRILPDWAAAQSLALAAHAIFCDRFILAWDIAYTPAGPVLAGASEFPDVELLQHAHHESIGESPLGLPLYEYLCLLEAS